MRFGISATSWIFPKNLRTRLRPVNVCAILFLLSFGRDRRGRDDSPESRNPSRPSGQASKPGLPLRWFDLDRTATSLLTLVIASIFYRLAQSHSTFFGTFFRP